MLELLPQGMMLFPKYIWIYPFSAISELGFKKGRNFFSAYGVGLEINGVTLQAVPLEATPSSFSKTTIFLHVHLDHEAFDFLGLKWKENYFCCLIAIIGCYTLKLLK